jgi:hypothetical protein
MKNVIFSIHETDDAIECQMLVDSHNGLLNNGDMASVIFTAASMFRSNVKCGCDRCVTLKRVCDLVVDSFGDDAGYENAVEDTIGAVAGCA